MRAGEHVVKVRLNDQELARLDEIRGDEERAVHMRRLLQRPPDGSEVATHSEALAILTRLARDERATPAIALERALRGDQSAASEVEAFLRGA